MKIQSMEERKNESKSRPSWHQIFMDILNVIIKRCKCIKLQTSAIVVRDTQIIAIGYNGTFSHHVECQDYWRNYHNKKDIQIPFDKWIKTPDFGHKHRIWSLSNEIHAEANALRYIEKNIGHECIMYTLYSPCLYCAKDIIAHGISKVYYKYKYKHGDEPIVTLHLAGIPCVQIV